MKKAVLYVCHGSRVKEARDEAVDFITLCKVHVDAEIQEISFLELAEPSIYEGFAACVEKGATHIAVVPLLLLTAVHAKKDIPEEIDQCMIQYPEISVSYGRPIGVHDKMIESVILHLNSVVDHVVLIGRGSSDPAVKRDLGAIAEKVQRRSGMKTVQTCFLTACEPSFTGILEEMSSTKEPVLFIPYLLFTGLLMKDIQAKIKKTGNPHLQLGKYLGYNHLVREAFVERTHEALSSPLYRRGEQFVAADA
ncbi:sirohydrochlorin chelatase [Rossellomorea marisflavi]|uniref:sirohydrochlorin chelatase n=1 Tax=Rossellomorea marisflavi TaxID=189381 RepID=UPI0025AFD6E7|nr:sirohydrochlorin chelatase [Rossellomorea marisflavi]WJV20988.1 sirohydrochlorin chelatase [Rossellomorea marisflavi]